MKRWKKTGYGVVLGSLIAVILLCLYKMIPYFWNNYYSSKAYQQLSDRYVVVSQDEDKKAESEKQQEASGAATTEEAAIDPEPAGASKEAISVDFSSLWSINPDIKAWICFDNLDAVPIDYPVLYNGNNNSYICPICGGKTRTKIRKDTVLIHFTLFCPKCRKETLIDLKQGNITISKEPDAKTQSR